MSEGAEAPHPSRWAWVRARLAWLRGGGDFAGKVVLVLLAAYLSNCIGPSIIQNNAHISAVRQAQYQLLDDYTAVAFSYQTLALNVSYFGQDGDADKLDLAFKEYNTQLPALWAKWRTLMSRANQQGQRDLSSAMCKQFNDIKQQDGEFTRQKNSLSPDWGHQHEADQQRLVDMECTISKLGADIRSQPISLDAPQEKPIVCKEALVIRPSGRHAAIGPGQRPQSACDTVEFLGTSPQP
ncbi:MAG TPA: hypothetical protein VII56_16950 [Rhizomicrobium sp.]